MATLAVERAVCTAEAMGYLVIIKAVRVVMTRAWRRFPSTYGLLVLFIATGVHFVSEYMPCR